MSPAAWRYGMGTSLLWWAAVLVGAGALWGLAWADTAALVLGAVSVGVLWGG